MAGKERDEPLGSVLFSRNELETYIRENLPRIHDEMEAALTHAMQEMAFLDDNFGGLILGSVMEYMRRFGQMDSRGKGRLGNEPISHEKLVAAYTLNEMARKVLDGMLAANIIEQRYNDDKKELKKPVEMSAVATGTVESKKNKKDKKKGKKKKHK